MEVLISSSPLHFADLEPIRPHRIPAFLRLYDLQLVPVCQMTNTFQVPSHAMLLESVSQREHTPSHPHSHLQPARPHPASLLSFLTCLLVCCKLLFFQCFRPPSLALTTPMVSCTLAKIETQCAFFQEHSSTVQRTPQSATHCSTG
ncbi:hypothetical protein MPTK1_4g03880 [Marchantia polymorpha subsp. ruderalis]|uniref:Uncharacterized protein n=2 Tax=Marchantia polymorpha TaxID=3197 RepID=A0AAF6B620_MARPO|nr:hypothetical protein MARPO_0044s0086 [Marchantia polymorpha]BBN07454.1 hypothetical protein Mp_4g03880 [Marchantia polymorpha subsp. ruderalis]|eukprot:PTQ39647.1 hypothetical protein MARPO_0044s0086 [Marchantia polymorpha]